MVSEALQKRVNGEAEVNVQKQGEQHPCHSLNGRCGKSGSERKSIRSCPDDSCREDNTGVASYKDVPSSVDIDMQPDSLRKKTRKQREISFQDMGNNVDIFDDGDDDDDDDSDWEPLQKLREIVKWFCTNCTMANLDVAVHCDSCGEHKESAILKHGFLAPSFVQDSNLLKTELEKKRTDKAMVSQVSTSNSSTAIGFDERMLLHSEVEMKSHPHPERPDRLRAIAASLATAGIFPGKCYPIPAREITKEELEMVHSVENIQAVEVTSNVISWLQEAKLEDDSTRRGFGSDAARWRRTHACGSKQWRCLTCYSDAARWRQTRAAGRLTCGRVQLDEQRRERLDEQRRERLEERDATTSLGSVKTDACRSWSVVGFTAVVVVRRSCVGCKVTVRECATRLCLNTQQSNGDNKRRWPLGRG